jgi:pimeloyl-ACP methyl ester carboxylesterase
MKQKFLHIQQGQVCYYEANEDAPKTLFFIHGNSGSSLMWSKQFYSKLRDKFRLVAIDLPGHGDSFRSTRPEEQYSPIGTSEIISGIIKRLDNQKPFVLVGFSYGTNLVAEMLKYEIRPAGTLLASPCVIGKDHDMPKVFLQSSQPPIFFYNESKQDHVKNWLDANLFTDDIKNVNLLMADYFRVSSDFKPVLFKTAAEGKVSDEIALLNQSGIPICVVFGTKDTLVNINYLDDSPFPLWQNHLYKMPGAGHWVNINQAEEFNSILSSYANALLK